MPIEGDTLTTLIKIWPVLVSLAVIIATLAVALYRIGQNADNNSTVKKALFKEDGTLVNVPAVDFKDYAEKLEKRIGVIEMDCKHLDSLGKDMVKVKEQQDTNLRKNLTVTEHTALCELQTYRIKELLATEFKAFKKELFAELGNIK